MCGLLATGGICVGQNRVGAALASKLIMVTSMLDLTEQHHV